MGNSAIKTKYAIVGTSAYRLEIKIEAGSLSEVELTANYPDGETKATVIAEKARHLINSMHEHAVNRLEYEAQIKRNSEGFSPVQKRAI